MTGKLSYFAVKVPFLDENIRIFANFAMKLQLVNSYDDLYAKFRNRINIYCLEFEKFPDFMERKIVYADETIKYSLCDFPKQKKIV